MLKHMCLHINYHVCMHMHAQTRTINPHRDCEWLKTHASAHPPRYKFTHSNSTVLQTDTHICQWNSHDHTLFMKLRGNCQNGRRRRPLLLPEPEGTGWHYHEHSCPWKLTLSTLKQEPSQCFCPPVCSLINQILLLVTNLRAAFPKNQGYLCQ